MVAFIYGLCALTAALCAWLLLRAYKGSRYRLLFWSGLFFLIVTINNLLLVTDKFFIHTFDLSAFRYAVSLGADCILLVGLISESK